MVDTLRLDTAGELNLSSINRSHHFDTDMLVAEKNNGRLEKLKTHVVRFHQEPLLSSMTVVLDEVVVPRKALQTVSSPKE
jgi:hypothetical protein